MKVYEYETDDIQLAAYLKCKGGLISGIKSSPTHSTKAVFTFKETDRQDIIEFNSQMSTVEPIQYATTMRSLIGAAKAAMAKNGS